MKPPGLLIPIIAMALAVGCSHSKKEQPETAAPEKAAETESRVKRGTNGEVMVTLEPATQKVMGLQTAALESIQLKPELKSYGRVLDPSPLTMLVAELTAAQATSDASQAELKRLKTLAGQNNASERALQTAEAAAARDQALAESTRLKLLAGWGNAISERKDLGAFVRALSGLAACLVELDVPAGDSLQGMPTGARLFTLADGSKTIDAQLLGLAPMADPQLQGKRFLLLVNPNPSGLTPGTAVTGLLTLPGQAETGLAVPRDAIVRFAGASWVYVQTSDQAFQRMEVVLASPLLAGWFVRQGLKPGDKVVTVGAQQLLSEELKSAGGEE
jgi:multidrug efflux pump subunit AcrA (membrane-fusion protein)